MSSCLQRGDLSLRQYTTKSTNQNKKNYLLDQNKFKDFGPRKNITEKSRIGGRLGRKIATSETNSEFISGTHTNSNEKDQNQVIKRAKNLDIHITEEEIYVVSTDTKRCLTLLVLRETQVKMGLSDDNKYREGYGTTGTFQHCWWDCELVLLL